MSTTMAVKKKVGTQSSTESSSGSTSDSSSSSSSTSGSDSSSSSDTDSTSSRSSNKVHSGSEQKKTAQVQKAPRKSTESSSKAITNKTNEKPAVKGKPAPQKVQKQLGKSNTYSSEDERNAKLQAKAAKRKSVVKPKVTANATVKAVENQQKPSGTSVSKSQKSIVTTLKSAIIAQKTINKPVTGKTAPKPIVKHQSKSKESQRSSKSGKNTSKLDLSKKKSIFSPENSSESDNESKVNAPKPQGKTLPVKPRPKATAKEKPKMHEKPKTEPKAGPKSKAIISSASSASTSSDSNSSSSESESSADSNSSKKDTKKPIKKSPPKELINSDTDNEIPEQLSSKQVTRKLTRSASTRISKHVVGKTVYSDTDSDTESTKRSLSRSPVKRAPIATKGKAKSKKNDTKIKNEIIIMEERKCPIEECNSVGHIAGKLDKHFTVDACPGYHNMTIAECKEQLIERKKREDSRRKTLENIKKTPRAQALQEQKAFQQKVKDMRAKFKPEIIEDVKPHVEKNREPDLGNFVPDYDLKLFKDAQAMASEKIEDDLKSQPNTKGTKYIEMGKFEMEVWYQSPYPEDYARLPKLYICEYCLRYMKSRTILQRHVVKCVWRHPPGEEVYRKDKISVWEVDGKRYKLYCQNLCLLAKFFLDHKTLYYDVEPFLFYVMTMVDNEGCHTVGYFSKEKNSFLNYNVSCILTLPPYQRQGYGRLLIDFSYLLTRVEGKIGSPEKPLSDLGLISYRSYWKDVLLNYLCKTAGTQLSVKDISQEMAIHSYDIVSTLQALGMMKYWKGKHIILRKQDVLDEYVERVKRRGPLLKEVDPTCLRWSPFVPPQANPA